VIGAAVLPVDGRARRVARPPAAAGAEDSAGRAGVDLPHLRAAPAPRPEDRACHGDRERAKNARRHPRLGETYGHEAPFLRNAEGPKRIGGDERLCRETGDFIAEASKSSYARCGVESMISFESSPGSITLSA
jgi:hypothetical protein